MQKPPEACQAEVTSESAAEELPAACSANERPAKCGAFEPNLSGEAVQKKDMVMPLQCAVMKSNMREASNKLGQSMQKLSECRQMFMKLNERGLQKAKQCICRFPQPRVEEGLPTGEESIQKDVASECTKRTTESIEIVFWFNGQLFPVHFEHKPVGIKWLPKPPIRIDEVAQGSHAEALGVQKGWQVKSVTGIDCSGQSYHFTKKALLDAVDELPCVCARSRRQSCLSLFCSLLKEGT